MPEYASYYVPRTKHELLIWIRQRYFNAGQTAAGLERYPKKRLLAVYYELISRVKEPELVEQS